MWMVVEVSATHRYDWPLDVQRFGGRTDRTITYGGVPTRGGRHVAPRRYGEPTPTAQFVDAAGLIGALGVH